MELKVCTKCKEAKPLTEYSLKRPKNRKPGLQPRCKSCCAKDTQLWNESNKETSRDRYLQRTYGISEKEYNARLLAQDNKCIICDTEFQTDKFGSKYPVVDHCHTNGHIRGILCNECNRGLGYFHDSREALYKAALYVQNTIEF